MESNGPSPDALALREMIEGTRLARAVYVITLLGVPDLLGPGPRSAEAMAAELGADAGALARTLRVLVNRGVFEEREDGFVLTPRGHLLRVGVPGSLRDWALWHGSEWSLRTWGEFEHTVRTGEPAFDRAWGAPFFSYLAAHPEMAERFAAAMTSISGLMNQAVVAAYDFGTCGIVADIGGGDGSLLALLLGRYPEMRAMLFDLPEVIEGSRERLAGQDIEPRVQCVAGDFFQEVPRGADLYVLKAILHDWNDEQAAVILTSCRRAVGDDATLLVVDGVLPPRGKPSPVRDMDLQMLAMQTGRERTEAELRDLLAVTGFELSEVRPTASPLSVVVASPV